MTRISDLVDIKKDTFFNGAVQAEWFYDENKRKATSESYIFHGPKYYGVSKSDIKTSNHKLYDTASFVETIYNKIYTDSESSRFALTIAGYGAGKSHLSVTMASLFSGVDLSLQKKILNNIKEADKQIYENIKEHINDKQFIIILNGINDFNLNREILKVAKQTLNLYGLDSSIFDDMTGAYKTARKFLENSFEYLEEKYEKQASMYSKYKNYSGTILKKRILENIELDYDAYNIINSVYTEQTGNSIRIDEAISASTVLNKLHQKYVVEEKVFKSIVVLFDEFGRYLEFASSQPALAGDTGLQQIFEAVQNASPSIIFVGFIQSDLSAYIARVSNDNIIRYVGRYQNSDKYYLSSNLETIIANLVKKRNEQSEAIISNIFDNSLQSYGTKIFNNVTRWYPELNNKSVWNNKLMFSKVILNGCYPIHPLTISLLCALSNFMQQRSTLSFLSDIFSVYMDREIDESIPFIYPVSIINSPIFTELLNAEERGRTSGQECTQFRELMNINEESLIEIDKDVLRAILISNITKAKAYDKEDAKSALQMMVSYDMDKVEQSINKLEKNLGIIYYDDIKNRYIFMTEGNSKIDFNREFIKKKIQVNKADILSSINDNIKKDLKLDIIEPTAFSIETNISTNEWKFSREVIDITDFTSGLAKNIRFEIENNRHPDIPKGRIIYLYCGSKNYDRVEEVIEILREYNYDALPILLILINDVDDVISDNLLDLRTLNSFDMNQRKNFEKFYKAKQNECNKKVVKRFLELVKQRQFLNEDGIYISNNILQKEITEKFRKIYTKTVPFTMDGFEKKVMPKVRKYYNSVIESLLLGKIEDPVEFNNLAIDVKNRINSLLSVDNHKSWRVLYKGNVIDVSQNENIDSLYNEIIDNIKNNGPITINKLVDRYMKVPYGMNLYSVSLLIAYTIYMNKNNIKVYKAGVSKRVTDILYSFNDEKKEQFNDFFKYELEYTEETYEDKLEFLISKIEKNRFIDIEKAVELREELEQIQEIDVPIEFRGRYFNCKETLNLAYSKFGEIERQLKSANEDFNVKLSRNPFIIRNILANLLNIKDDIIEGSSYRYSKRQIKIAENLREKSVLLCKESLEKFRVNLDVSKFNEYRSIFISLIKQLPKLGEISLANDMKLIFSEYEEKYKQSLESKKIVEDIKADLADIRINVSLVESIDECEAKINNWIVKSTNLMDLNNNEISILLKQLKEELDKIQEVRESGIKLLEEINSKLISSKSIREMRLLNDYVLKCLNEKMLPKYKCIISELLDSLRLAYDTIAPIEYKRLSNNELNNIINDIIIKNNFNKSIIELLKRVENSIIENNNNNEIEWRKKYLISDSIINSYDVKKLREWQIQASKEFEYLSEASKEEYEVVKAKINSKISQYKIENIVEIFNELSPIEKKECILLLSSINK